MAASSNRKQIVVTAVAGLALAGVIAAIVVTQFGSSNSNGATTTTDLPQSSAPATNVAGLQVTRLIAAARAQQENRRELSTTFFHSFFASLSAAAGYFGITWPALQTRLEHGKSLAQLADAAGKSKDDLVKTMLAAHKRYIDAAVAGHTITKAQEGVLLADVDAWMKGVVDGTGSAKGFGGLISSPLPNPGERPSSANGVPAPTPIPAP